MASIAQGSALGKSSKHDIQHNHTINIMVATTPVANAMGNGFLSPWAAPWALKAKREMQSWFLTQFGH